MNTSFAVTPSLPAVVEQKQNATATEFWSARNITKLALGDLLLKVVAPFTLIASTIAFLFNTCKFIHYDSITCKPLQPGQVNSLQPPSNLEERAQAEQTAIRTVQNCMTDDEIKREQALQSLKENAHSFVVSLLSIMPFLGLLTARAYAKTIHGQSTITPAEAIVRQLFKPMPGMSKLARFALFPISNTSAQDHQNANPLHQSPIFFYVTEDTSVHCQEETIPVKRQDGKTHTITCHTVQLPNKLNNKKMLLFGGNKEIGLGMKDVAQKYLQQGWDVCMVTLGGYPGSDEGTTTTEVTAIQDIAAVLEHLKDVPTLGVHGFSIGAALAMHAAQLSERIQLVVLDKPFTTPQDVAANLVRNTAQIAKRHCDTAQQERNNQENIAEKKRLQKINDDAYNKIRDENPIQPEETVITWNERLRKLREKPASTTETIKQRIQKSTWKERILLSGTKILSCLPSAVVRGAVLAALPPPQVVPGVHQENRPNEAYLSDNLDNLTKVSQLKSGATLIIIGGTKDDLMGTTRTEDNSGYNATCSDALKKAATLNHPLLITTEQKHVHFLIDGSQQMIKNILDRFNGPSAHSHAR